MIWYFKCITKCGYTGQKSLRVTAGCKLKDNTKVVITEPPHNVPLHFLSWGTKYKTAYSQQVSPLFQEVRNINSRFATFVMKKRWWNGTLGKWNEHSLKHMFLTRNSLAFLITTKAWGYLADRLTLQEVLRCRIQQSSFCTASWRSDNMTIKSLCSIKITNNFPTTQSTKVNRVCVYHVQTELKTILKGASFGSAIEYNKRSLYVPIPRVCVKQ